MIDISLPIVLSSFALIFLVELPDKTALAAITLSTKYKAKLVFFGVALAFLIQTLVGVLAGRLLLLVPAKPIHIAAGIGFLIFALFTLHSDEAKEFKKEEKEIEKESKLHKNALVVSFLVIFASEWGDLSQLATAALVARTNHPLSVGLGALLALWSVTILAIITGKGISRFLTQAKLKKISGILFLLIGLVILALTFFPLPGAHF